MRRMTILRNRNRNRCRWRCICAALAAALVVAPGASAAASSYWIDKPKVIGFAAIALNRPMSEQFRRHARENAYWGDPERCGALFSDYLDILESQLAIGAIATLPTPLAELLPLLDAPQRPPPDARIFSDLDTACSKRGVREYGTWCNDLLVTFGITQRAKEAIRIAGARSFLAELSGKPNPSCPRAAGEGEAWLRPQLGAER